MCKPEQHPRLPIPPALMVSEAGSFAQYTIRERLPAIIQRTIADNPLSQSALTQLEALTRELSEGVIRPIREDGGADVAAWSTYVKPFEGHSWFDIPFYFAEAYFYRRILEAIAYFQTSPAHRLDPFAPQKQQSLEMAVEAIRAIAPKNPPTLDSSPPNGQPLDLIRLLHLALWGNRVDLSLWSATESNRIRTEVAQDEVNILVNHSHTIADQLSQIQDGRFDFIVDNAGFELVCDLVLVDFLLSTRIAGTVHLHLKPHPLFVSDAMIQDVHNTLALLAAEPDSGVRSFADRVRRFITCGSLHLQDDDFWTAPLPFWEMPPALKQELAQSQRVFVKGDANYRRLLGDCHWAFTTPLEDVVSYFPASPVALRTLKSEVIVGLEGAQIDRLNRKDPQWLINGQWGVIHTVNGALPENRSCP
jgi:hypothetical protein